MDEKRTKHPYPRDRRYTREGTKEQDYPHGPWSVYIFHDALPGHSTGLPCCWAYPTEADADEKLRTHRAELRGQPALPPIKPASKPVLSAAEQAEYDRLLDGLTPDHAAAARSVFDEPQELRRYLATLPAAPVQQVQQVQRPTGAITRSFGYEAIEARYDRVGLGMPAGWQIGHTPQQTPTRPAAITEPFSRAWLAERMDAVGTQQGSGPLFPPSADPAAAQRRSAIEQAFER